MWVGTGDILPEQSKPWSLRAGGADEEETSGPWGGAAPNNYKGTESRCSIREPHSHCPIGLGMSLADELLADLEEAAEEEEGGSYGEEEEEPAIEDVQEETQLDLSGDSVKSIAKLWDSKMVRWYPISQCPWEEER